MGADVLQSAKIRLLTVSAYGTHGTAESRTHTRHEAHSLEVSLKMRRVIRRDLQAYPFPFQAYPYPAYPFPYRPLDPWVQLEGNLVGSWVSAKRSGC